MQFVNTTALKAALLAGQDLTRSKRHADPVVQAAVPVMVVGHVFNHGLSEVHTLCGGIKVDWAKGAAFAATAFDLAKSYDIVKGTLKRK